MTKSFLSLIFLLLIFISSTQIHAQIEEDNEIVKIESSLVVLNATITDSKGLPVAGLSNKQFRIFEDGIEQTVEVFEAAETPFAAVILLDTSGSMEQRISLARSAAINFLGGLRADDFVAIYNFDSKVSLVQDFSNSRDVIPQFFDLKADGWTVLNDAVNKAAEVLQKRSEKRKAIVILSDGADNKSRYSAAKSLKAALAIDATIYTVDMSSETDKSRDRMVNQGVLKNFAEKTGGLFISTPGGSALRQAFENIVEELGTQYTLGYQSSNIKKTVNGEKSNFGLRVRT